MKNNQLIGVIEESFKKFLETSSRSNEKLKILHGFIAGSIKEKLGSGYEIKSLGIGNKKEGKIEGRYNDKNVDITILKDNKILAGVGVKFVMQNYKQNTNNYFETMLGETANIRSSNKLYFQILIISEIIPYYQNGGNISKWEKIDDRNLKKYSMLSEDNPEQYVHTPDKTLIFIISLPDNRSLNTRKEYKTFHRNSKVSISDKEFIEFQQGVILNDFEKFLEKICYRIKSI